LEARAFRLGANKKLGGLYTYLGRFVTHDHTTKYEYETMRLHRNVTAITPRVPAHGGAVQKTKIFYSRWHRRAAATVAPHYFSTNYPALHTINDTFTHILPY
jgi:hypothetical protein